MARGTVEVDVYIETPNELVKQILCECKYWNTPVTKEKVHAFRTVVYDSGAELGIMISKNGYQSGAIDAAKYSNIRLETWESFLNIIMHRWIDNRLWTVKKMAARVMSFDDVYDYECEKLTIQESIIYRHICNNMRKVTSQSCFVTKSKLMNDNFYIEGTPINSIYSDIEEYLNKLYQKLSDALEILEKLSVKPNKPDRYISTMKAYMDNE
ncbi:MULTISPECIES: restriction endonuclease [unclassified Acetobacterium]|uniref:restriction endonuclease n=1 Tax=unclassified Acetobacterium TaxID=2638182 RepID=UPI00210FD8E1|nr:MULTISPECIES: restriction endonuclease [unclassified Acetobacterium]MDZ5726890.1 restriction endonuclease [Acetobacterium sp. K1/6]